MIRERRVDPLQSVDIFRDTTFDVFSQGPMEQLSGNDRQVELDPDVDLSVKIRDQFDSDLKPWFTECRKDFAYYLGAQRTSKALNAILKRRITAVNVDVISPAVEQAVSILSSRNPRFTATAMEDSDPRQAKIIADLFASIWNSSNGRARLKVILKHYYVRSVGWIGIEWNPNAKHGMGEIELFQIDPDNVLHDSAADDLFFDNASHILVRNYLTLEQVQMDMPQMKDRLAEMVPHAGQKHQDFDTQGSQAQHWRPQTQATLYEKLDRYSRVYVPHFRYYEPSTGYEKLVPAIRTMDELEAFQNQNISSPRNTFYAMSAFIVEDERGSQRPIIKPKDLAIVSELFAAFGPLVHKVQLDDGTTTWAPGDGRIAVAMPGMTPVPGSSLMLRPVRVKDLVDLGLLQESEVFLQRIQRVLSVGEAKVFEGILPCEHFPIIPLINNFDGTSAPQSDIRRVRGLQEYINTIQTLIVAHAYKTTNFKVGYPRGAYRPEDLETMMERPGFAGIPYDAELGPLTPIGPAPLPTELYKTLAEAKADVERILGIYPLMQGSPNDAPNTYKGTVALDEYGMRRMRAKMEDVESFLNRVGTVVLDYIQAYYTSYRVVRLTKPNDKQYVVAINTNRVTEYEDLSDLAEETVDDITVGKFDVQVVSGSTLPTNRYAMAEYYLGLYKEGVIDQEEMLKKSEVVDTEGVLRRTSIIKQLQSMVEQLQGQVKMLSGDLQTAQRSEVNARKNLEVERFKSKVTAEEHRNAAASTVFRERLGDEITNARLALRAGLQVQKAQASRKTPPKRAK